MPKYKDFKYKINPDNTITITKYTGNKQSVVIPPKIGKYIVTNIGHSAFYRCTSLTNINIPNNVTNIGVCAFLSCLSLKNITLPDNIEKISNTAFANCFNLIIKCKPGTVTEKSLINAGYSYISSVSKMKQLITNNVNNLSSFPQDNTLSEVLYAEK